MPTVQLTPFLPTPGYGALATTWALLHPMHRNGNTSFFTAKHPHLKPSSMILKAFKNRLHRPLYSPSPPPVLIDMLP